MPIIPQPLLPLLPVIAVPLAGWLSHDALPKWANTLIALITVAILAIIAALLSPSLTNDLVGDILLIFAYCLVIMAYPGITPLQQWFTVHTTSPLALFAHRRPVPEPAITATNAPMTPYSTPQGIDLRGTSMPASQREWRVPSYHTTLPSVPPVQSTRPMPAVMPPEEPGPTTTGEE